MQVNKLRQYRDLLREIENLKSRKKKAEDKSEIVRDITTASNPEFPYQPIHIRLEGIDTREVDKINAIIVKRYKQAAKAKYKIEKFISDIDDSRTRMIFERRYIDGWSWIKISMAMGSTNESYARMIHDRYLK
ncbi:hypothetical protein ING2D1G_0694 [Peptoniphilus sp. ING2-D1G]|nr:hypothetical protein ING2D1G_0694 [Peptoniphilus sp. ING2-D1G]